MVKLVHGLPLAAILTDGTVAKEALKCCDFHSMDCSTSRPAMSSCYVFCIQTAYTVRAAIHSRRLKLPTDDGDRSFPTTAVGSAVRSSTCSPPRFGGRLAIAVPPSSKSCAVSLKVLLLSIWPT